jgi:hypothetical protein
MNTKIMFCFIVFLFSAFTGMARAGTEGTTNTFYGSHAGNSITGQYYSDTFIGAYAGTSNTSGQYNTFLGYKAGYYNTSGQYNTFLGNHAGYYNTTGIFNTFLGNQAGYFNATGDCNIFLGSSAGKSHTSGHNNTFLGFYAGYLNITGSGNVFLGYRAGYTQTGSNKLYIANSQTTTPLIYGEFDSKILIINGKVGIGTKPLTHPLEMASGAHVTTGGVWTDASSREYKDDIRSLATEEAFDTLKKLNPVKFIYKADRTEQHVGFIAEDVPELIATKDRKGLSSMDIAAVLTKVVQEQQRTMQEQQKTISTLKEELNELKEKIK